MKLIKLHDNNEARPFYLNVDTIHTVDTSVNLTLIYNTSGHSPLRVKETPEEIIALIEGGTPKVEEKEARWFVVFAHQTPEDFGGADEISSWKDKPTKKMEDFINLAETEGQVYSGEGFMWALNNEEIDTDNCYFLRTTKY